MFSIKNNGSVNIDDTKGVYDPPALYWLVL
jgi:hypothetical protein